VDDLTVQLIARADAVTVKTPKELRTALAKRKQPKKPRKVPSLKPSRKPEAAYFLGLQKIQARLRAAVGKQVIPAIKTITPKDGRQDAAGDRLALTIKRLKLFFGSLAAVETLAEQTARAATSADGTTFRRTVATVIGIRPELSDKFLKPLIKAFTQANARLVKQASDRFLDKLETQIREGVAKGLRAEVIQQQIQADFVAKEGLEAQVAKRRAKLIARDQVASLASDVAKARQTQIGVKRYVWRTSEDERVRASHRERDGVVFEWGKPIEGQLKKKGLTVDRIDGPPGRPINCRCIAEPVLQDLLGDLDELKGTGTG